ncbi:MFS transporter, partial [Streptomyces sp. DJ]
DFAGADRTPAVAGDLAAGDLSGAVEAAGAADRAGLTEFLVTAYDGAFHTVLWTLAGVCLLLGLLVVALLRGRPARQPSA